MRDLLLQATKVLTLGLAAGLLWGAARGFPDWPPPAAAESATCAAPVPERPEIAWVSASEAHGLWAQQAATFLDARDREAFLMGHVAGAVHAPMTTGAVSPEVVDRAAGSLPVIAYDAGDADCAAATRLARLLSASGVADVRILEGGFPAWLGAGYPAESGGPTSG